MIQHTLPSCNEPVRSAAHRQTIHISVIPDTEYILPVDVRAFQIELHCRRTPKPFWLLCSAERLLWPAFVKTRHGLYVRWVDMQCWWRTLCSIRKRYGGRLLYVERLYKKLERGCGALKKWSALAPMAPPNRPVRWDR